MIFKSPLFKLFLFFSFFPYLSFFPSISDNQPYALFVGLILCLFWVRKRICIELLALLIVFLFSVFLLFLSSFSVTALKSVVQYMSLFVIPYVTFEGLNKIKGLPYNIYVFAVFSWFLIGVIQFLYDPTFGTFLLFRAEGGFLSGRGITSLAPEPTFYGMMCAFFLIIGFLNFKERKNVKVVILMLLIQLLVFSRSSTVIFSMGLAFVIGISIRKSFFHIIMVSVIIVFLLPVLIDILSPYRAGKLLRLIYDNPLDLLVLDGSVNSRMINVFFPIYGFIRDLGIPHGYDTYASFMKEMHSNTSFNMLFSDYVLSAKRENSKIGSGIGSMFFELGWIAFIPIIVFWKTFKPLIYRNHNMLYWFILYIILMLNSITFTNALASFVFGNVLYVSKSLKRN